MSLIGTLEDVRLGDVLRLFAAGRKSGVLSVEAPGSQGAVHFVKGAVVHAEAGRFQGDEAMLDLFGWKHGQLTFVVGERPVAPNVSRDVEALIEEGEREGERFHRMRELIPSDRVAFQMAAAPEDGTARVTLGAVEWSVLRVLDGVRDVREVAEASRVPRDRVLQVLFDLADAGFLERVEVHKSLRVQSQGLLGKDSAAVDERLEQDWMKIARFAHGILRIELRTLAGRAATVPVTFRAGLYRDVQLPRPTLAELGVRDGDDVSVRPVA